MSALDRVLQLQSQGMQESDIIRILREENISPIEVNDALNQAKVKSAVSGDNPTSENQFSDMQQSMLQDDVSPEQMQEPMQQESAYPQYPQQQYEQQYAYPSQGLDTETITEIAEQIVIEKFDEFNQRTGDLVSFKAEMNEKVRDLSERIKRIETSLDKIQQAIISKIGEYGENLGYIKKDMSNVHETMSKLMNPLVDNYMEMKKLNESK